MSRRSWANPAPFVLVGGSEDFLVRRERLRAFKAAHTFGRHVLVGCNQSEIEDTINECDTFGTQALIWLEDPKLADGIFEEFSARKDNNVCIVLSSNESLDPAKLSAPYSYVPDAYRIFYNRPSSRRDRERAAVKFATQEAARNKIELPENVAEALVSLIGDDLGVVSFELEKAFTLARARKLSEVSAALVRETIRPSTEVDLRPLMGALVQMDPVGISKALVRLPGPEVLPLLLRGKGGPADVSLVWLQAAELMAQGSGPEEISSRLNQPKWAVEKEILPAAKRWGKPRLLRLVVSLSKVESALFRGAPSAWNLLSSSLISSALSPQDSR